MPAIATPTTGQVVRFTNIPAGSYATAGVDYVVTAERAYIHIRNVATGSGTSDARWAYARAKWDVVS